MGPTPFWYATRGSGFTALVLLTASVLLGLVTSVRWTSWAWPRFLSQGLHRNVSLLAALFLLIHIATSIIDPFAGLSVRDAVIPVGAGYRPLWLGLGVIATELFVAIVLTSLLRRRLSFGVWRIVHLLAYASWPVAVLHGIGTGTDTKAVWAILLVAACVVSVVAALVWRLSVGWPSWAVLRVAGIAVSLAAVVALAAWTAGGPLQPGWARTAGTPQRLLSGGAAASPTPAQPTVAPLAAGLDDPVSGSAQRNGGDVTVQMQDQRDSSLTLTIVAQADGNGSLTVFRNGHSICAAPATISDTVTAQCGQVNVAVQVSGQEGGDPVSGRLITQ